MKKDWLGVINQSRKLDCKKKTQCKQKSLTCAEAHKKSCYFLVCLLFSTKVKDDGSEDTANNRMVNKSVAEAEVNNRNITT